MPVRICLGITEFGCDPILLPLRDEVLQPFCFVVDFVPRVIEEIMEEALQQTMVAKNLQSSHLAGRRQTRAMMLFVFHEGWLLCSELLQHSSYGSRTDTKMLSVRSMLSRRH